MSNFINDIEITNFKSIRHQKIDGCKRINVFIGYPNVGKSNILEAIGSTSFFQYIYKKGDFSLKDLIRIESPVELFFEGDPKRSALININDSFFYNYLFDKKSESFWWDLLIHKHDNTLLDSFQLRFHRNFQIIEGSLSTAVNQFNKKFKESDFSIALSKAHRLPKIAPYHFKTSVESDNDYTGSLMFPFGENLMRILNEDSVLRSEVSDLFKGYGFRLALDKSSQTIKIIKENKDDTIFILPYNLIADTLQRLIFYKAAIASNSDTVLLFEEPESHMFPPYISKFTGDIINDKNNNQYFIATHSPFVINDLLEDVRDDLSIYTVGYKNGETTIKRLTDKELNEIYQYGIDLFFNLEQYLADA